MLDIFFVHQLTSWTIREVSVDKHFGEIPSCFFLNRHIGPEILKSIKSHVMCNSQCLKATKQNNNKWYSSTLSHLLLKKRLLKHRKNRHLQHLHPWCHGKGDSLLNLVSWPQQKKQRLGQAGREPAQRGAKPAASKIVTCQSKGSCKGDFLGKSSYPGFCDPPNLVGGFNPFEKY